MKYSLSILPVYILSLILVYSCSTEEEESVAPVVQTPQPEPEPEEETQSETDNQTQDDASNETLEVDTDGDGVVDSEDAWPFNPFLDEDIWGQDVEPELFFASDVSEYIQEQFRNDLNLAIEEFGNFGPLEIWVLGTDKNAMLELAEIYCERRISRGQIWEADGLLSQNEGYDLTEDFSLFNSACLSELMHPYADVSWYNEESRVVSQYIDQAGLDNYTGGWVEYGVEPPLIMASINGHRGFGFHYWLNSLPYQYEENDYFIGKEDMAFIIFHEYFHVTNLSYVFAKESVQDETGNSVVPDYGPTSMREGSADYMGWYTLYKLIDEDEYNKSEEFQSTLREEMKNRMNTIQENIINCPNFNLANLNGDICDPYIFGSWAIAYLNNRAENQNSYQELMFPLINDLGYYGAFEEAFGITFETFNQEFLEFLELPIEQQLEIIPDI